MRIVYVDIDSLRSDHLGCYGYLRDTSPRLDALARDGVRFARCYTSDAPCLPSRTALLSGRFGYHTGVINHGGIASQPFLDGPNKGFRDCLAATSFPSALRSAGYHNAAISPFPMRHSAWHWTAGFHELHDTGAGGQESAHEVFPVVSDWLARNAARDNWFLYVNLWDPHTPYRVPAAYGEPFSGQPQPDWLTESVRQSHWASAGPHGAQEIDGWTGTTPDYLAERDFPRQPWQAAGPAEVRRMFDGYDTGVRYADDYVGRIVAELKARGLYDDTLIVVSSDHGENLGELGIYGDHQTADHFTCHVPLIVKVPGFSDRAGTMAPALIYSIDWMATLLELAGADVPANWDGRSFAAAFRAGDDFGREYLVTSQAAWTCQRGVRWKDFLYLHSYHDGYRGFPDELIFDLAADPHEQHDLASSRPDLRDRARGLLAAWLAAAHANATHPVDPMTTVLAEGGPFHIRGELDAYVRRLRATGRSAPADALLARHGASVR